MPNAAVRIEQGAFKNCRSLAEVKLGFAGIACNAFEDCIWLTLRKLMVPTFVTHIEDCAFTNCAFLTELTIPTSVASVGKHAFSGGSSLREVRIPNSVTFIGEHAFKGCHSLQEIVLPEPIRKLHWGIFQGCAALAEVNIPNSVTNIGTFAFADCGKLAGLTFPSSLVSSPYRRKCLQKLQLLWELSIPKAVSCQIKKYIGWDGTVFSTILVWSSPEP